MKRLVLILVALALLISSGAAHAATVEVRFSPIPVPHYVAAPGELNRLVVTYDYSDNGVTFTDPGAVIAPGTLCSSTGAHSVHCKGPPYGGSEGHDQPFPIHSAEIELGDMDDELHVAIPTADLRVTAGAGPGADTIVGGEANDQLDAGGGHDQIRAGGGDDVLMDGDRSDGPPGTEPQQDDLDGGAGTDTVSYFGRSAPVSVDLAGRSGGERDESDRVDNVESVTGGDGDDQLRGDGGANVLFGGAGDDLLAGRRGDDTLVGFRGADNLFGDAGSDVLDGGSQLDRVACGPGQDEVTHPATAEVIRPLCELVGAEGAARRFTLPAQAFRTYPHTAVFRMRCPGDGAPDEPCAGRLKLREAGGRGRVLGVNSWAGGEPGDRLVIVRVHLTDLGAMLAARRGGVRALVLYRATSRGVNVPTRVRWTIRLRTAG